MSKTIRQRILDALEADGPMTSAEIAHVTKMTRQQAESCVLEIRAEGPGQLVHVSHWVRARDLGVPQLHLRPVYAPGPGKNARKPAPMNGNERRRLYTQRVSGLVKARESFRRTGAINPFLQLMTDGGAAA